VSAPRREPEIFPMRPAVPADLDEIAEIERLSFPVPWRLEFFEGELRHSNRYHRILERAGSGGSRVAAYLFAIALPDEFHINKIATHPDFRGRGLGRRLLEDAIEQARGRTAKSVVLEVRLSNVSAIDFYKSFGFTEVQRRKRYYLDGEDALVMMLTLLDLGDGAR
jgi:ribosomal-protein-alanine N-acetyltransferase